MSIRPSVWHRDKEMCAKLSDTGKRENSLCAIYGSRSIPVTAYNIPDTSDVLNKKQKAVILYVLRTTPAA